MLKKVLYKHKNMQLTIFFFNFWQCPEFCEIQTEGG